MKFGFHTQLNNWQNELSHSQLLDNLREQARLCDELGFDAMWLAEHHLNPEGFGNSPNPVVLAADLAAHTSRIKIGFSCVTATMWHPLRLAEDLALLDHLTKGRIEVGFGRGGRPSDTIPFNLKADPRDEETNRRLFTETMDIVVGAWTNEFFSHEGPNYTVPPKGLPHHPSYTSEEPYVVDGEVTKIRLVPKPYQQPHPPLWTMAGSERTAKLAADRGYNAMAVGTNPKLLNKMVDTYAEARSEKDGRQFARGEGWALLRPVHVAPTMEQARSNFEESVIRQRVMQALNRGVNVSTDDQYSDTNPPPDGARVINWETLLAKDALAGPPDHVTEQINSLKQAFGIDYIIAFMDAGGVDHSKIMSSIELLGKEVMPAFNES